MPATSTGAPCSQAYDDTRARCFFRIATSKASARCAALPDQYGDSCENCGSTYTPADLKNPLSVVSGTAPVWRDSEHYFFRLSTFESSLACLGQAAARCRTAWPASSMSGSRRALQATGTSRATRRTSASRSPTHRVSTSMSGSMHPSGIWVASHRLCARTGLVFDDFFAGTGRRHRTASFHRQGHPVFPHAVLAGGARGRRAPTPPHPGARAWFSDRQRPKNVQVARHRHHRTPLSRAASAGGISALLPCRQARARHRRSGLEPGGIRDPFELGHRRQAREHRQPLCRLHRQECRRDCSAEQPARSRALRCLRRRRRTACAASYESMRHGERGARHHGPRRPRQPVHRSRTNPGRSRNSPRNREPVRM